MGGIVKTIVVGAGLLIGAYLALSHATEGGKLLTSAGSAGSQFARTLQGR